MLTGRVKRFRDAPRQEQVVEHQQTGEHPALEQERVLVGIGQGVSSLIANINQQLGHGADRHIGNT